MAVIRDSLDHRSGAATLVWTPLSIILNKIRKKKTIDAFLYVYYKSKYKFERHVRAIVRKMWAHPVDIWWTPPGLPF